jgi:DNA-binding beta-propeller fold protein YncE
VAQDDRGNLYVCEYGSNDRVQKFDAAGRFLLAFGKAGEGKGEFQRASGILWRDGLVYVADATNNRIHVFTDAGAYRAMLGAGLGLRFPYDVAPGPDGSLYVIEYGTNRITRVDAAGRLLGRFGRAGTARGAFRTPWGIAVGGNGRIVVADTGNRRLVELAP